MDGNTSYIYFLTAYLLLKYANSYEIMNVPYGVEQVLFDVTLSPANVSDSICY